MDKPIYLDNNATTPIDPAVFESMRPFLQEEYGNAASSSHPYGWSAKMAVDKARKQVAQALGADPKEIIFTSGATESNNIAILGLARVRNGQKPHFITSNIEHKAVLEVVRLTEELGAEFTILPVDKFGQISAEQVQKAIKPNTKLVSIMSANNEIGTINPIEEIGEVCRDRNVLFHTDAAQAVGKLEIDVKNMNIDLLSISGHKIYGPKGIGALYIKRKQPRIELKPMIAGGAQEGGIRPGTHNVPAIVGLGKACELCVEKKTADHQKILQMRTYIMDQILSQKGEVILNGHPTERLCNNLSFSFMNLTADMFALGLSGLAVSSGSACTSETATPSHVLTAIGHDDSLARATLRIGLGRFNQMSDAEVAVDKILKLIQKNRDLSQ